MRGQHGQLLKPCLNTEALRAEIWLASTRAVTHQSSKFKLTEVCALCGLSGYERAFDIMPDFWLASYDTWS